MIRRKRVAWVPLAGGRAVAAASGSATGPACAVELTEIRSGDQAWWSLGFEATGPAGLLRSARQGSAGEIFAQDLPGDVEIGVSDCQSYAQWLGRDPEPRVTEAPKR